MAASPRRIDVFLSCSSDVHEEEAAARDVIGRLNGQSYLRSHCVLAPLAYKDLAPAAVGEIPQEIVERYMGPAVDSDIFVCFRWHRAGTPMHARATGTDFPGGVDYEFQTAYEARIKVGRPQILLYRCLRPIPSDADLDEAKHVQKFFARFEGKDAPFRGLFKTYTSSDAFKLQLFQDLLTILFEHFLRPPGLPAHAIRPYRHDVAELIDFYASPFVSREKETTSLMEFARRETPGYRLIEATGGYGKTAFFAHLVQLHESGLWVNPPRCLYFFVRKHGEDNTANAMLRALNGQLLAALDLQGGMTASAGDVKTEFEALWARASAGAGAETPLLLIVDSIDEMAREKPSIVQLLPASLAPYVHVVVSARPGFDVSSHVSPEHPLQRADRVTLASLTTEDLSALLQQLGVALERSARLATQVVNVTKGLPLYARFVCQDVARDGESALERLPEDVNRYFVEQVRSMKGVADGDILCLLAVALGGMTQDEIRLALGLLEEETTVRLAAVGRFLLGKNRVELMHLELRTALRNNLDAATLARHERKLVEWCESYEAKGWPADTPAYVVLHYAEHLRRVGDRASLSRLIARPWMQLHVRTTGSYQSFANDVEIAMTAAAAQPPDLVALAHGSLARGTLTSLAAGLAPEVLGLMTALGRSAEARGYAALNEIRFNQCEAYRRIGEALLARREPHALDDARAVVQQAFAIAEVLDDQNLRVGALGRLGPALFGIGELGRLVKMAGELDEPSRLALLGALANASWKSRDAAPVRELLRVAESMDNSFFKTDAVSALATALALLGDHSEAERVIDLVGERGWAGNLSVLLEQLVRSGQSERAVVAVEKMDADQFQASYLADIVRTAAEIGQIDVLERALQATASIGHSWTKADAVSAVALAFAEIGNRDRCLELARAALIVERQPQWAADERRLEEFEAEAAVVLAAAGDGVAASKAIGPIQDEYVRARALAGVEAAASREGGARAEHDRQQLERAQELVDRAMRAGGADKRVEADALLDVARKRVMAGDDAHAVDAASRALALARESYAYVLNGREQSALAHIAEAFARGGDLASAYAVCARLRTDSAADSARASIARALAAAGEDEAASAAIRQIVSAQARNDAWASIAQRAARNRQTARAQHAVACIDDRQPRDAARGEIVEQLVGAGDPEAALVFARSIEDASLKSKRFGEIGLAFVASDQVPIAADLCDEAAAIVPAVVSDDADVAALCAIDNACGRSGTTDVIDRAIDVARAIGSPDARARAYRRIAQRLVESGDAARALEFVDRALACGTEMEGRGMAVSTLTELAAVSAEAGDTAKALRLVTDVTAALNSIDKTPGRWNPRWDLVLLSRAATTLARVGHTDRAVTMAAEILAQTSLMRPEERPKRRAPGSPLDDFFDRQDTELESRRQFSCVTAMVGAAEAFAGSGRRADGLKTVRDAVVVAEAIVGAVQKANAFIDIGRSLANMEARQLAIDALTRADDVLRLYVDQRQRTPLEILLAPAFLRCERRQDAVRVWTRAMSTAQLHGRRMVLSAIEAGAPIVAALEGPDTVWKLYELVVDVDRWWSADRRA